MSASEDEVRRDRVVFVRLSNAELVAARELAQSQGRTVAGLVRWLLATAREERDHG